MILYEPAMLHGPTELDALLVHELHMRRCPLRRCVPVLRIVAPEVRDKTLDASWEWVVMFSYDLLKLTMLGAALSTCFHVQGG